MKITDELSVTAGKLVLSPTRTYAPVIKKVLDEHRKDIHGMVHCSGGGQTKILHFVDKLHVTKNNLFPCPPLFQLIKEQSGTEWKEMYKVRDWQIWSIDAFSLCSFCSGINLIVWTSIGV